MHRFTAFVCLTILLPGSALAQPKKEPTIEGKSVKQWTAALADKNSRTVEESFDALVAFGPHAKPAIPEMLNQIARYSTGPVHIAGLEALRQLGPEVVVPVMIETIKDSSKSAKEHAAAFSVLKLFGPKAKDAVPALIQVIEISDKGSRHPREAEGVLIAIGADAVPAIIKALKEPELPAPRRVNFLFTLRQLGNSAKAAVPTLVKIAFKDDDPKTRNSALFTLVAIGPDAKDAVAELRPLLKDPDCREAAVAYFCCLGADGKEALPVLMEMLKKAKRESSPTGAHDPVFRHFKNLGPAAKDAIPDLIAALKGNDGVFAWNAVEVLGELGEDAVAPLIDVLKKENDAAKLRALHALAAIGFKAKDAIPLAEAMLKEANNIQKDAINLSLGRIGGDPVPHLLEVVLKDTNRDRRLKALRDLQSFGTRAKSAVPNLLELSKRAERELRVDVLFTLAAIGGPDKRVVEAVVDAFEDKEIVSWARFVMAKCGPEAIPELLNAVNNTNPQVRAAIATSVGNMRERAKGAAPKLLELLKGDNGDSRAAAAELLGKVGADADKVVPALLDALKDKDVRVRGAAAHALGQLGAHTEKVVSALIALLKDDDTTVRNSAIFSLGQFGNKAAAAVPELVAIARQITAQTKTYGVLLALGRIGAEPKTVVPVLIDIVKTGTGQQSATAVKALAMFGETAREAAPAIRDAMQRHGSAVDAKALRAIAPKRLDP